MLELRQAQPLATGHLRYVYQHPHTPDLMLKVMRPDVMQARWEQASWYRRRSRTGPYRSYVREFKEYLASRHQCPDGLSPLARVVGLEDTDIGLAQVVEKVHDAEGRLAPTLTSWVRREGLTPKIRAAMDELLQHLLEHNVILGDLHAGNVVYGITGSIRAAGRVWS